MANEYDEDLERELEAYFASTRRAAKPIRLSPPKYKKRWRAPVTTPPEMFSPYDGERLDLDQKKFPSWARRDTPPPEPATAAELALSAKQGMRGYYAAHAAGGAVGDTSQSLARYRDALARHPRLDWSAWNKAYCETAAADREEYRRAAQSQRR